jgi:hypothetical protein
MAFDPKTAGLKDHLVGWVGSPENRSPALMVLV